MWGNEIATEVEQRAMMAALPLGMESQSKGVLGILIASGLNDREAAFAMKICSGRGNNELVGLLLGMKSDWSKVDGIGESLAAAAGNGDENMVRQMLAAKFPVDCCDSWGRRALMHAVRANKPEVVKILADAGANINARVDFQGSTTDGWSAMHTAAMVGKARMIELLVSLGADADAKSTNGATPLMVVASRELGGVDGSEEEKDKAEAAEALIAAGADVRAVDASGDSVAVLATRSRYAMILSSLLRAGVDKDQRSGSDGRSLLVIALSEDAFGIREECAKILLDAGAMPPERMALTPKGRMKDFVKIVESYGYVQVLGHLRAIKESRELAKSSKPRGEASKSGKAKKTWL